VEDISVIQKPLRLNDWRCSSDGYAYLFYIVRWKQSRCYRRISFIVVVSSKQHRSSCCEAACCQMHSLKCICQSLWGLRPIIRLTELCI
jgi:hypothetical protein